uniref:Uncharacterized protein n=1 Tax=Anguilla anguilla TaxID=7936 RepID=A0A0E9TQU3_ANGAN
MKSTKWIQKRLSTRIYYPGQCNNVATSLSPKT